MKTFLGLVIACTVVTVGADDDSGISVETPEEAYQQLLIAEHWRDRNKAVQQLEEFGEEALPWLIRGTKHGWEKVREECLESLFRKYPDHEKTANAVVRGLSDGTTRIRYTCAFFAGRQQIAAAEPKLRKLYKDRADDLRITAAKSLAQLGHADVIRVLYHEASNDWYMHRMQANAGLKALSGRDLDDFGDYKWNEGAYVSGGIELRIMLRPIEDANLRSRRYRALAEYCRWLKQERPDLYVHLAPHDE